MDRSHLNQKDMKNCKLFAVCSQKVFKMSTICTDTCLEIIIRKFITRTCSQALSMNRMLSSLVNCSVDNVRSEIGPCVYLAQLQSFKPVKDNEWTKRKMLILCTLLMFAPTLWHLMDICCIDDTNSRLKRFTCMKSTKFLILNFPR